jgi:hypothetical protein
VGGSPFIAPAKFAYTLLSECMDSPPSFQTVLLSIEPAAIARFKAIIESYDNLATLRTEDRRHHYLRLYFDDASAAEVDALLDWLSAAFSLRRIGV